MHTKARTVLEKAASRPDKLRAHLAALLLAQPLDLRSARSLAVKTPVLGFYQSGRATGPGASRDDSQPTSQNAWTSAWELALVVAGLRAFSGSVSRRPEPGSEVQASFPLLVLARAVGLDSANAEQLREEDSDAYELLAPLWSAPAAPRAVRRALGALRVRVGGGVARDALEAAVAHAAAGARDVGFDRLVRFVFVKPNEERDQRYALRRGVITAHESRAAALVAEDPIPFLRRAETAPPPPDRRPELFRRARHALDEAAVAAARSEPAGPALRALVLALTGFELAASRLWDERTRERQSLANLGPRWDGLAAGASDRAWRLGRALAWVVVDRSQDQQGTRQWSWLREPLLPHRRAAHGWRLDPEPSRPELLRSGAPLDALLAAAVARAREAAASPLGRGPVRADLGDLVGLLAGEAMVSGRALAGATLAAARLDRVASVLEPSGRGPTRPARLGIGRALATVLLAAQPDRDEPLAQCLERRASLAALAVAGAVDELLRAGLRALWVRELDVRPVAAGALATVAPARLALALLLEFDDPATAALRRQVGTTAQHREGADDDDE